MAVELAKFPPTEMLFKALNAIDGMPEYHNDLRRRVLTELIVPTHELAPPELLPYVCMPFQHEFEHYPQFENPLTEARWQQRLYAFVPSQRGEFDPFSLKATHDVCDLRDDLYKGLSVD